MGKEQLAKEVYSLFPDYQNKDMHACNFGLKKRSLTLDAELLTQKVLQHLQMKENFTLRTNSEISSLNYSRSSGLVKSVSVLGKMGQEVECDAVVVCTGAYTAQILYNTLGIYSPLTPIKSYTFDMATKSK